MSQNVSVAELLASFAGKLSDSTIAQMVTLVENDSALAQQARIAELSAELESVNAALAADIAVISNRYGFRIGTLQAELDSLKGTAPAAPAPAKVAPVKAATPAKPKAAKTGGKPKVDTKFHVEHPGQTAPNPKDWLAEGNETQPQARLAGESVWRPAGKVAQELGCMFDGQKIGTTKIMRYKTTPGAVELRFFRKPSSDDTWGHLNSGTFAAVYFQFEK